MKTLPVLALACAVFASGTAAAEGADPPYGGFLAELKSADAVVRVLVTDESDLGDAPPDMGKPEYCAPRTIVAQVQACLKGPLKAGAELTLAADMPAQLRRLKTVLNTEQSGSDRFFAGLPWKGQQTILLLRRKESTWDILNSCIGADDLVAGYVAASAAPEADAAAWLFTTLCGQLKVRGRVEGTLPVTFVLLHDLARVKRSFPGDRAELQTQATFAVGASIWVPEMCAPVNDTIRGLVPLLGEKARQSVVRSLARRHQYFEIESKGRGDRGDGGERPPDIGDMIGEGDAGRVLELIALAIDPANPPPTKDVKALFEKAKSFARFEPSAPGSQVADDLAAHFAGLGITVKFEEKEISMNSFHASMTMPADAALEKKMIDAFGMKQDVDPSGTPVNSWCSTGDAAKLTLSNGMRLRYIAMGKAEGGTVSLTVEAVP